jgi:nucleoside-diphosphate-sugar epimerase
MIDKNNLVLVTGATGFTGSHLIKTLCAAGVTVRAIARASSNREALSDLPVDWVVGDVFDEQTVAPACSGVNIIFHVAAAYREAKISDDVYWNVHVKSTQLLAKYAQQQSDFKRFVHISTVGVHGHIDTPPVDETYRFSPGDQYQITKVEAEQWIQKFSQENNFPITIVRPAAIYGPGDRRLLKVFKLAKLPIIPILGIGCKGLYHLIHVSDLVNFMILAASHPKTLGEVYLCGNENPISIKDMISLISQRLGRSPIFIRLPATPLFWLGDICEFICKPLNIEPPIYRRRVAFFTKDRWFNTNKLRQHTGYEMQYSSKQGIEQLTDWYRRAGWL